MHIHVIRSVNRSVWLANHLHIHVALFPVCNDLKPHCLREHCADVIIYFLLCNLRLLYLYLLYFFFFFGGGTSAPPVDEQSLRTKTNGHVNHHFASIHAELKPPPLLDC